MADTAAVGEGIEGKSERNINSNKNKSKIYDDGLPQSLRNAPIELRTAIRRRQNSRSAARCRLRNREEVEHMEKKFAENEDRIKELARAAAMLEDYLRHESSISR